MSIVITESDTFPTTISTPVLGDKLTYPRTMTSALTDLANRARFLYNRLTDGVDGGLVIDPNVEPGIIATGLFDPSPFLGPLNPFTLLGRSLIQTINWMRARVPGLVPGDAIYQYPPSIIGSVNWSQSLDTDLGIAVQTSTGFADWAILQLPALPVAGVLKSVRIRCVGNRGGGASALPANMPAAQLVAVSLSGSAYTATTIGSASDTSFNIINYSDAHVIEITGLSENLTQRTLSNLAGRFAYHIKMTGESGTNSVAQSFAVMGIECVITGAANGAG